MTPTVVCAPGATDPSIAAETVARERRRVELALRGDAMAFRAIVERHHRGMYALAVRMLHHPADAEDVVQEAFARAFCRLQQYDPAYRLSTWLYRIVLNLCRDQRKSARRREQAAEIDGYAAGSDAQPDALTQAAERGRLVREALDRLRPSYREILILKDLQELSYIEIRDITGAPITSLKIRAIRARKKLRKELGEDV